MNKRQLCAIAGAILVMAGALMPIVKVPFVGAFTYFDNGWDGKLVGSVLIGLAVVAVAAALRHVYVALWLPALAGSAVLAVTYVRFISRIENFKAQLGADLEWNPLRKVLAGAGDSVQMASGWIPLIAGVLLILAAAAMKEAVAPVNAD